MKNKFILSFKDVPLSARRVLWPTVTDVLKQNGWCLKNLIVRDNDYYNYVYFGDSENYSEYDSSPHCSNDSFKDVIYHVISDWDKWSRAKYVVSEGLFNLNEEYTANITLDGVKVGCQTFSHSTVLELADKVKEFLDTK